MKDESELRFLHPSSFILLIHDRIQHRRDRAFLALEAVNRPITEASGNDLGQDVYDSATGGCCDGLQEDRINRNQGAESTLAFLLSLTGISFMFGWRERDRRPRKGQKVSPKAWGIYHMRKTRKNLIRQCLITLARDGSALQWQQCVTAT